MFFRRPFIRLLAASCTFIGVVSVPLFPLTQTTFFQSAATQEFRRALTDSLKNFNWTAGKRFDIVIVSTNSKETPVLAALDESKCVESYGPRFVAEVGLTDFRIRRSSNLHV